MDLDSVLVPAVVFYFIFKIFELYVRRGERLRLIEKLDSLSSVEGKVDLRMLTPTPSLGIGRNVGIKIASLLIGMGLGALLGMVMTFFFVRAMEGHVDWSFYHTYEMFSGMGMLIFGGLGLLIPSIILRDEKKEQ
ncbi:hypothetical protein [Porphyromonas loveana]|uniref:hypothetical protein n=1 Tax=Porphyromonas loveana TaxID=1884669 RepID=UPI0035A1D42C